MFKHPENEEDLFFSSITSSKLASIFETTVVPDTSESSSGGKDLTYSAPKQPTVVVSPPSKDKMPDKKTESHVSLVKVVYGYKYVNNAYESLGKVGFALVESPENNKHNIILYKNKNHHLFNIRINKKIVFTIQENKYLTLLDEQKKNWSLLFENQLDLMEFYNKLELTDAKIVKPNASDKLKDTAQLQVKTINIEESLNQVHEDTFTETENYKSKSEILSRMAKVGQLSLPPPAKSHSSEVTDSEGEIDHEMTVVKSRRTKKLDYNDLPVKTLASPAHSKCLIFHKNQQIQDNLGSLLLESRTQNTEVRMNLLKLENKLDKLFEKTRNENDSDMNSELMKLQLQNEQLKLDLQKMQLNKMVTESNTMLNSALEKAEIGVQFNSNRLYGCCDKEPFDEIVITENGVRSQLDNISQTSTEINSLRDKYECLAKEIENLEKKNRKQELKIHSLEAFFCEVQPLRKYVGEIDEATIVQSITECTDENSEVRHKLKQLTDSMQDYMSIIELQDRKIRKLENYFRTISNDLKSSPEVNDSTDVLNRVQEKLNDFDEYFKETQSIKTKLDDALQTIKYFEKKICNQEAKLSEFISTFQEKKDSTNSSDLDISICSACLQLQRTELNTSDKKSDEKVEQEEKSDNVKMSYNLEEVKQKINESISPLIKEEMNTLYGELQSTLKEDSKVEATSLIVKTTYRIIQNIQSHSL